MHIYTVCSTCSCKNVHMTEHMHMYVCMYIPNYICARAYISVYVYSYVCMLMLLYMCM